MDKELHLPEFEDTDERNSFLASYIEELSKQLGLDNLDTAAVLLYGALHYLGEAGYCDAQIIEVLTCIGRDWSSIK